MERIPFIFISIANLALFTFKILCLCVSKMHRMSFFLSKEEAKSLRPQVAKI